MDSLGRYRLQNIPRGEHLVVARAVGFQPDSAMKVFDSDEALVSDVVLKVAISELPTAAVKEASHRWRAARWPRTKGARRSALDTSSIETFWRTTRADGRDELVSHVAA